MADVVERLRWATVDPVTCLPLDPGTFGQATVEDLKEAAAEIERLRAALPQIVCDCVSEDCRQNGCQLRRALPPKE